MQIGLPPPEAPRPLTTPQPISTPVTMTQAGIPRAQVDLMRLSLGFRPGIAPRKPTLR
jgi:hypothetical protein